MSTRRLRATSSDGRERDLIGHLHADRRQRRGVWVRAVAAGPQGTKPPVGINIIVASVSISSRAPGQFELFVAGNVGLIWGLVRQDGAWCQWLTYGGPLSDHSRPTAMLDTRVLSGSGNNIPLTLFFQEAIYPDVAAGGADFGSQRDALWSTKVIPRP
jgi:hypothetical protein